MEELKNSPKNDEEHSEIPENINDPFAQLYKQFESEVKPSILTERESILGILDNLTQDLRLHKQKIQK